MILSDIQMTYHKEIVMKKSLITLVLLLILTTLVVPAYAGDKGQGPDPDHGYGSQPGYDTSASNTECQGHGAFGAFGNNGDVVHDFGVNNLGSNGEPGASGYQTGLNNSALCGNRQNP
jgi:hypothetical protein